MYRQALESALECFNDPERRQEYLDCYADDVVLHGFPPELPPGKAGLTAFYGMVWNAFPDAVVTVDEVIAEADRVATLFRLSGTHRGEFMGIPARGAQINVTGMTIIRFAGDKIAERWSMLDQLALLQQIGALPASDRVDTAA